MALTAAVIGGGPGGMTAALLLKQRHPDWSVEVFERNPADATFGYGVGLRAGVLAQLADLAPACAADLEAVAHPLNRQSVRRDGVTVSVSNAHGVGISRSALLTVVGRHAERAGVVVRTGRTIGVADVAGADIVIGADGVGSETRGALADRIGASAHPGELLYLWCGASLALPAMTLNLTRTPSGPLTAHVMPYGPDRVTFQVDGAAETIKNWDDGSPVIARLEEQFADLLGGQRLATKQAGWSAFTTVRCAARSAGRVVLIGDAALTAHYTVGSGTALAMADAFALVEALDGEASMPAAFAAYEDARRAATDRLQRRAQRSERWWTTLGIRYDAPLPVLLAGYLTRTGALGLSDLARLDPRLVAELAPDGTDPHDIAGRYAPGGDAEPVTVAVPAGGLDEISGRFGGSATPVRLAGPPGRDAVLDRMELAELLRARAVTTIVQGTAADVADLALGALCRRTDYVEVAQEASCQDS
ncbi:FAD-dependent monooxygenase [Dactylosporangium sp. CA-092794]|uniref:FAD-dependent monooxygenase n=1 Tax=Dactylosporangium sp. CA-092794 TaxID=3239929 RepID=UPI003D8C8165